MRTCHYHSCQDKEHCKDNASTSLCNMTFEAMLMAEAGKHTHTEVWTKVTCMDCLAAELTRQQTKKEMYTKAYTYNPGTPSINEMKKPYQISFEELTNGIKFKFDGKNWKSIKVI